MARDSAKRKKPESVSNELSHSGYSAREGKSNSNSDSAEKSAKKSKKTTVSANEKAISKTKPSKESNENSKTKTLMQVSNPHELNEKMDPSLLKSFKLNLDKSIEKFLESNKEDNWEGNAVPTKSVSKKPSQPTASAFKTVSKSISTNACSEPDVLVQKFESALGIQASSSISTETAKKAKQTDLQGTRDQEKSALDLGLVNKKLDTKPEHLRFDKHKSVKPISVATIPKPHSLPLAPHFLHGKATSSQQEKSIHASSSKSHSLSSQDPSPSYPSPPFSSSLYPSPPNLTPLIPFLPNPSSLYSSPNPSSLYSSSLNPSSLNSSLSSQHPSLHLSSLNPSSSNAVKSLSSTERFPQYSSFIPAITSTTTTSTTSSSSSSQLLPSENVLLTMRALNVMKMKFGKTFTFSATERIKEKEKEVEIEKEEGRLIATNHFTTYQMEKETVTTSSSISSTAFKTQSSKSMHSFMNSLDPRLSIFLNENAMKAKENEKGIEKEEGKVKIKEWNLEKDAEMEGEEKMKGLRMEENREGKETKFIQNQKSPPLKENEGEEDEGEEEEEKEEKKDGVIEKEKEKVIKHFHDGISMDVKQYLLQNFGKLPVEWRLERGSGDNSIYIHEMDEKNEKKEENRLIEIHDFMSKKSVEKVVEEGKETKEGNEENEGREEEERGGIVGEETEVEKVKVGEKQREKGAGEMVGRGRKKEKRKRKSNIESIQSPYKKLLNYKHYDKDREEDDGDGDGVDKNSDKNDDKNIVNSNLTEKEVENKKNVEDEDYGNDDVHDDDAAEVLIQLNQNLQSGDFTEKKKNELEKEKGKGKEKDKQIVMLHDNGDDGNDGDDSNDNIKVNEDDDDDENHNMDIGHSIQDKFIIIYNDFKESEKELEENRLAVQNNINNLKEVERKANLNSTLEKRLDEIKVKMNHDLTIAKLSENKYKSQRQKLFKLLEETRIQSIKEEERQLDAALSALEDYQRSGKSMLREEVTGSDIAEIVSKWTGIPVSKLQQSEREKLLHLDEELHQRVVGQDAAVQAIAEAIQRSRAGLSDPNRPIASFMFLGPTGVGKTELAKALAAYLFNTEDSLVRIDMSEYMEKHAVSRLIGAPPGYVGYEEGGQLTEAVRRRPYAVLLFDEIEKAHGDVFNIFLQILDDGRVTDSQGRTVNFNNTVIIMTSNIGSQYILSGLDMAGPANAVYESVKERVLDAARANFRPEFMNRVDEFIVFRSLDADQIERIVRLQIERLEKRLKDRKIEIRVSDAAVKLLSNLGYDPSYGARPVKRVIQQHVENALAKGILRGDFGEEDMVDIDVEIVGSTNGGLPTQKLTFTRVPRMASPSSYDPMAYMPM